MCIRDRIWTGVCVFSHVLICLSAWLCVNIRIMFYTYLFICLFYVGLFASLPLCHLPVIHLYAVYCSALAHLLVTLSLSLTIRLNCACLLAGCLSRLSCIYGLSTAHLQLGARMTSGHGDMYWNYVCFFYWSYLKKKKNVYNLSVICQTDIWRH